LRCYVTKGEARGGGHRWHGLAAASRCDPSDEQSRTDVTRHLE
jgi:hypothetical protein